MLRIIPSFTMLLATTVISSGIIPYELPAQINKPVKIIELSYEYTGDCTYGNLDTTKENTGFFHHRIVYVLNDSIAKIITGMLDENIRKMWVCDGPTPDLMKHGEASNIFNYYNKTFKGRFRKMIPKDSSKGNYLFMEIIDGEKGENGSVGLNKKYWTDKATHLNFELQILSGKKADVLFSRKMRVLLERTPVPGEEYPLSKIPGLPDSFMTVFRRAADIFFGPDTPPDSLVMKVPAACLLLNHEKDKQVKIPLHFSIKRARVDITGGTGLSWQVGNISTQKVDRKLYFASNLFSALLFQNSTSYTDYWFVKRTPYHFPDDTSTWLLTIPYKEEREDDMVTKRAVVSDCFFTRGKDTVGRFGFWDVPENLTQDTARYFWDGYDSATIRPLPVSWTNRGLYKPTVVKGVLFGKNFLIQNALAGNRLDIRYDGKLIATIKTDVGMPETGFQYYADLPLITYRALMVLATIPFAYYGQ